ncbi:hypothetical protein NKDENANG_00465 [Candidatus Entotheonellaceae bacterium PAL068K]
MFNTYGPVSRAYWEREVLQSCPRPLRKLCQIGGFFLPVNTGFLALGVGSYSAEDSTWDHYGGGEERAVRNLVGLVGASLADRGFRFLWADRFSVRRYRGGRCLAGDAWTPGLSCHHGLTWWRVACCSECWGTRDTPGYPGVWDGGEGVWSMAGGYCWCIMSIIWNIPGDEYGHDPGAVCRR